MTESPASMRGPVYFCFADPSGFSGQKAATEMVINGLACRNWTCRRLPQPVLDRSSERAAAARIRYLFRVLAAWTRAFRVVLTRGWLCVNLGQTRASFVRDLVPLLVGWAGLGRDRVVVSLHGSLFTRWPEKSLDVRVFRFLLGKAGAITVLGERQRSHLVKLGLPDRRVVVVVNSCEVTPDSAEAVEAKHTPPALARPVRVLHLGSLIDTKGFPEYLEALARLSTLEGPDIEAVLCGTVPASQYSGRFAGAAEAEQWIGRQADSLNRNGRVRLRWIAGAQASAKLSLFREADIFVLPTRYAVEAQPLVLLEAMASGCAIVTTRAGEIPTILDDQSAYFVGESLAENLPQAMQLLRNDVALRRRLALAAHDRFVSQYRIDRHLDRWEALLRPRNLAKGSA